MSVEVSQNLIKVLPLIALLRIYSNESKSAQLHISVTIFIMALFTINKI
jgi:hypothetical protein